MAGRPTKYEEGFCEVAEATLAEGFSLAAVAGTCGVCLDTVYEWQKQHPEFSDAVKRGRAKGALVWEARLAKLAETNTGNATGIIFGLKNRFPEEWKDVTRQEQTGPNGGPVEVTEIRRTVVDPRPSDA